MSDVIYAKAPENQEPMSVADAQTKAQAQAQGFAEGGDVAAFLQGLGGGEGGGGYQNLIQSMQPQGRAAPQRMQTAPAQPAPMPMPAPSGGMGGLDMLTLAALLQGQQGGGTQVVQTQQTEDPAIGLKRVYLRRRFWRQNARTELPSFRRWWDLRRYLLRYMTHLA